jgi:hypothetical protein
MNRGALDRFDQHLEVLKISGDRAAALLGRSDGRALKPNGVSGIADLLRQMHAAFVKASIFAWRFCRYFNRHLGV